MKTQRRTILVLVTLLTLLSQLALPTLAYADDQPPATPTEAATELPPPTEEAPTEASLVETPIPPPTEVPAITETHPASEVTTVEPISTTDVPSETAPAEEPPLTETLAEIPAETDVVVLDENGQPLPLVTQEVAEIISTSDPIWCPAGLAPTPGANGCTSSYTSLGSLLSDLSAVNSGTGIAANGTIWIASSYNSLSNDPSATNFSLKGSTLTTWANYALTLQGGWSGISGDNTIGSNSVFSVPITISNWNQPVVVHSITVTDTKGITLENIGLNTPVPYTAVTGIVGKVNIENVSVSYADDPSNTWGLVIANKGDVSLSNINASGYWNGFGTYIDNTAAGNKSIISISGNNNFSYSAIGLVVKTKGAVNISGTTTTAYNWSDAGIDIGWDSWDIGEVLISGVTAYGNSKVGLLITNSKKVTLKDINASNNYGDGVNAHSSGDINLENVTSSGNSDTGIYLVSGRYVTLKNITTNQNQNAGIFIYSGNPALSNSNPVTLTSITSNKNRCAGLHIVGADNIIFMGGGSIQKNMFGLLVDSSTDSYPEYLGSIVSGNTYDFTGYGANCDKGTPGDTINAYTVSAQGEISFTFDCATKHYYPVNLPNGDRVTIFCPVTGTAFIKRLDSTMLPDDLPSGYSYISAFSLDIQKHNQSVSVIKEGGHVDISFKVPTMENGVKYAILYWDRDKQTWIPLKDLILETDGGPSHFSLYSGDSREITKGFNIVQAGDTFRAEITTNFPGTFVLAQY